MAKYCGNYKLSMFYCVRHFWLGLFGSLLIPMLDVSVAPSFAAERVSFRYGIIQRSLPVEDLRTYAETREASSELKTFLRSLSSESQSTVQEALQIQLPLNVVTVDRLLRTPYGQKALSELDQVVDRGDDAGIPALRAALILGTNSSGGLGVLNFLEAYPSKTITINLPQAIGFIEQYGQLLRRAPEILNQGQGPL